MIRSENHCVARNLACNQRLLINQSFHITDDVVLVGDACKIKIGCSKTIWKTSKIAIVCPSTDALLVACGTNVLGSQNHCEWVPTSSAFQIAAITITTAAEFGRPTHATMVE